MFCLEPGRHCRGRPDLIILLDAGQELLSDLWGQGAGAARVATLLERLQTVLVIEVHHAAHRIRVCESQTLYSVWDVPLMDMPEGQVALALNREYVAGNQKACECLKIQVTQRGVKASDSPILHLRFTYLRFPLN